MWEVHFQTERLGWHTDDFLIVCQRPGGAFPKLAGQVKTSFTVSAVDDDCKQTIQDFWLDFNNPAIFSPKADHLVLVTLRGTNTLLEHFVGLLNCARAARSGAEFEQRLTTKGFISQKAVTYCSHLQQIIGDLEGTAMSAGEMWPFLRILHVLSLDLHTSTRQTEAHIKSLLAHTAQESNGDGASASTWSALLDVASTAMSDARSITLEDLPTELLQRHLPVGPSEHGVLRALRDHTGLILRGIRSTIGNNCHVERGKLEQKVLAKLETAQVVFVSGPAGCGKSAIGKAVVSQLSSDHFTCGFRAEEFAQPHFDTTLSAAQIPANGSTLGAILAAQGRKIILVESIERLLEKSTREAFSDLMTLVAADINLRVILTCRDYSLDQVRTSFLQQSGTAHEIVSVPPLDDEELGQVEAAVPALGLPLRNPALRQILRNPYFLDKAGEIAWSAMRPVPESEREFRMLFWREIVRADHRLPAGMGRRREAAIQEVAVRRARALTAYVPCNDLDPSVVEALLQDSLISAPASSSLQVTTAHDVLEDWAILQWLEEQHLTGEGSYKDLSAAIGTYPAIRRSYRRWVAELVQRDAAAADRLFEAAVTETGASAQFRDDTLVSLLMSPSAPEFLIGHEAQLLANERALLKRVIFLLRVACMKIPTWMAGFIGQGSIGHVPTGPSWAPVIEIAHRNWVQFTSQEYPLLLGLIEDAVRQVTWRSPGMDGAQFVAGLGHSLLVVFDAYNDAEQRGRVLKVLARIPKADPVRFEAVLRGTKGHGEHRDHCAHDLRKILFAGVEGLPAARDLPDLVVSSAYDYLLASEADLRRRHRSRGDSTDLATHFGIKEGLDYDQFPSSALRGPWIHLLRFHPDKALDLILRVVNTSADWYVHPRVHDPLEPAWEVALTFSDGTRRKHWHNPRLWNLYRGTSVGPHVLKSMLMACEAWLLELGGRMPDQLDVILTDLLARSESAAMAGLVASVATAFPHSSVETLLVLLSVPDYILCDRGRMVAESQASALSGIFPQVPENRIYGDEREEANTLAHRRTDLESAVLNLQLGPAASRVQGMLDRHAAALSAQSGEAAQALIWRLALHRMDLRQYTMTGEAAPQSQGANADPREPAARYFRLDPKAPDREVQLMVDESAARYMALNARLAVLMWGVKTFKHESDGYDPSEWYSRLAEAQAMDRDADDDDGTNHAPGFVAAVCVRDHWDEMDAGQQAWCVDVVCSEIMRKGDESGHGKRLQRFSMSADRPGARILSLLVRKALPEPQMNRVREAFAAAVTHPIDEVQWEAAHGITQLWAEDRRIAMRAVNAIAMEAALLDAAQEVEWGRPYEQQRPFEEIRDEVTSTVRERFWKEEGIGDDVHLTLDTTKGFGADASTRILTILSQVPNDPVAVAAFSRAGRTLVKWWDSSLNRDERRERNYHIEAAIAERLHGFVMQTTATAAAEVLGPILEAVDRHPREIYSIVAGLTSNEVSRPNTSHYWYLWSLFADRVRNAKWVPGLKSEHPVGSEMLSAIFLTLWWRDEVRHWKSLEGNAHLVDALFDALPPTSIVLDSYLRFLYHIGERSLPQAFVRVRKALDAGDAAGMLRKTNTIFILEVLLQRHVYGRPLELKRDAVVRQSVLTLLDILVENGSSAAFRMRDDFVTPAT